MNIHTVTHTSLSDAQIRTMVPNIYLERRQQMLDCSWTVVIGVNMNKVALHVFFTMQLFKVLGQMANMSRADIAEGCLLLLGHDRLEVLTADKNIYSAPMVTINEKAALHMMEDGLPMAQHNITYFHDYEDGKKNFHADPRINSICMLAKDADSLERVVEQIEGVANNTYPRRRWERPEVQAECAYKRENFNCDVTRRLYDAIMEYGEDAFDDAFLRLPNAITNGSHGKYGK